ncbi:hypothetical protein DSECCO2_649520 [anaerobic digester metagenome]
MSVSYIVFEGVAITNYNYFGVCCISNYYRQSIRIGTISSDVSSAGCAVCAGQSGSCISIGVGFVMSENLSANLVRMISIDKLEGVSYCIIS